VPTVTRITVEAAAGPHEFSVVVSGGTWETRHLVTVPPAESDALGAEPAELVRAAFEFLLEREPARSILQEFEIGVIRRYFPEFDDAMALRFGR
jgi:hypothetical protein